MVERRDKTKRDWRATRSPAVWVQAILALLAAACSPRVEAGPPMPASRVVFSFLARPSLMKPAGERRPPRVEILRPHGSVTAGGGQMPAVMLETPADLRFEVPDELPRGTRLHVEMCVKNGNYRGTGNVRFRWSQGQAVLLERELPAGAATSRAERRWYPASLGVSPGEPVRLEVLYEGDADSPPSVCVGELELRQPLALARTFARRDRPNIVLMVIDTLRADRLTAYGGSEGVSPNFDRLARAGTLFERAFSTAPWTAPATASILSALAPSEHGVDFGSSVLSPSIETLAEVLRDAGFTTAGFSSNDLISKSHNFDQGFEHFTDYRWKQSEEVAGDIVGWLEEHHEHRFFLYVHVVDPHGPYEPAPAFADAYTSTPPAGYEGEAERALMARYMRGESFERSFLDAVARHIVVSYDGEIASVDDLIGRIDGKLVELGLDDRTLVCVTSDHGEEFMEHGLMGHVKQIHLESVHVPLALRGPGVPADVRVPHDVQNHLIGPTLMRLAGVSVPEGWERGDLMQAALDDERAVQPVFFSTSRGRHYNERHRRWGRVRPIHGVLAGRWLLFWLPEHGKRAALHELFDLESDPKALLDVAAEHPQKVEALHAQIEAWMERDERTGGTIAVEGETDEKMLRALGYIED